MKGSLIPVEAQPAKTLEDAVDEFRTIAIHIGVFDSQNKRATLIAREQPVEQGGARAADVQIAGGRGRETHADLPGGGRRGSR